MVHASYALYQNVIYSDSVDIHLQAPSHTEKETQLRSENKVQSQQLSTTATERQEHSRSGVLSSDRTKTSTSFKPVISAPLQLADRDSLTTHRAVTPVLPEPEKTASPKSDRLDEFSVWELSHKETLSSELFSPMSSQFLVPPDYEAVFSGQQTLRVSECSQASPVDLSPVSPVFSDSISPEGAVEAITKGASETTEDLFSPDFRRVLSEFEKTLSAFGPEEPKAPQVAELRKDSESPQHSDSDLEFFDCSQALSDISEPEEVNLEPEILYNISEPPSPLPGSSPDSGFLKGTPEYSAHPFLRMEDCKHLASGSESLGEFAYDLEGFQEYKAEGVMPTCEELPSRDQAGYDDDDDDLERVRGRA